MHRMGTVPSLTKKGSSNGFTIVELLIVIVVIAILAAIVLVSYNGVRQRASDSAVRAAIAQMVRNVGIYNVDNSRYPGDINSFPKDTTLTYQYTYTDASNAYCMSVSSKYSEYYVTSSDSSLKSGVCSGHTSYVGGGPAPQWTAISTSDTHSCGIYGGKAYCWGNNANGQLGNGTTVLSNSPVAVKTTLMSGTVTDISTGTQHSCAVAGGKAYCWGNNGSGRLGNNSTTNSSEPVAVTTSVMSGTVTDIATGYSHSCAVANSAVYCWGQNLTGQLGNAANVSSTTPLAVATNIMSGTATAIIAGYQHTCAIASGNAYCWGGYSGYGQLGNGTTGTSTTPVAVSTALMAAGSVTSLGGGSESYHTCAISANKAYCWGHNGFGKLGDASTLVRSSPVAVTTSAMSGTVVSIAAGGSQTCAVDATGGTFCWGANSSGQLGDGGTSASNVPKAVTLSGVTGPLKGISTGASQSCAYGALHAYCWGQNGSGQLGIGSTTQLLLPAEVIVTP